MAFYITDWGFPNDYNKLYWPIIFNKRANLKIYANQDIIVILTTCSDYCILPELTGKLEIKLNQPENVKELCELCRFVLID